MCQLLELLKEHEGKEVAVGTAVKFNEEKCTCPVAYLFILNLSKVKNRLVFIFVHKDLLFRQV